MRKLPMYAIAGILFFAACKKDSQTTSPEKGDISATQIISYDKTVLQLLEKNYQHPQKRDSLLKIFRNTVIIKGEKLSSSNARLMEVNDFVDDNGPYGNAYDSGYPLEGVDNGDFFGLDWNGYSYNMKFKWYFSKRNNILLVTTPITYSTLDVTIGTPSPVLIGSALGSTENQSGSRYSNANLQGSNVQGSVGGVLIEKRTIVTTSNGNTTVSAGLNAEMFHVGAEVAQGVTITQSLNSTTAYTYDYTFTLYPSLGSSAPVVVYYGDNHCEAM